MKRAVLSWALGGLLMGGVCLPAQAATFVIVNNDSPGEGFNDDTPRSPVGGNPGDTLGEQRLIAFQFAADLLGSKLTSSVTIRVAAHFDPLDCGPTRATLGQAGATTIIDFENDPPAGARANTLYPVALANALARRDLDPGVDDIAATFNSSIDDNALCLTGTNWYYGLDNQPGGDLDFLSTVAHELIHGLGFASFANLTTGQFVGGTPDIYSVFIRDLTQGANWDQMTAPQRSASASNDGNVVWSGPSTTSNGAPTLSSGTNQGQVQLYAPTVTQPGSSISHWDTRLTPNALMEPFDTGDTDFDNGIGLSTCLLQDVGWTLLGGTRCPSTAADGTMPPMPGGGGGDDGNDAPPPAGGGGGGGSGSIGLPWLAGLAVLLLAGVRRARTPGRPVER